jgi:ABC-type transport system involved in cytochrome c biogenesis permease subunit
MMRRLGWLTLGVILSAVAVVPVAAAEIRPETPRELGVGPAYEALARLAVLHEGRVKPLDTLAREEVKQIFGRESRIKLLDASKGNAVVETWGPVAALYDWSVRPEFWDEQPFILVEYQPLKRLILADSARARLMDVAGKPTTAPADREALKRLADDPELSTAKIDAFLKGSSLEGNARKPGADRQVLSTLAAELSEEHKWLAPRQIEESRVAEGEAGAEPVPFRDWFSRIIMKKRQADADTTGSTRLTDVEKRAIEVGTRLVHYKAIRDREMRSVEPMQVMPRPSNAAYLSFLAKTYEKARKAGSAEGLSLIELDGAKALDTYWTELPTDERAVPGSKAEFDRPFTDWLASSSAWIPLRALLDARPADLEAAGFPADKVGAFLTAFKDLEKAEEAAPGKVDQAKAEALVAAARSLGEAVSPKSYPTVAAIDRETYFNATNPFFKAPVGYGLAVALLAASLGFQGFARRSFLARAGQVFYALGLVGLVVGIAYEAFGFYLRVKISGWAPVTNMYETVIWVSLVSAVLGLVFEAIYRKTFAALAGSGVALLGTILAANVPLLDPGIKQLQPVLRSNYWLTIHVITEVSSYGAFLMAAGLGLIATMYYLTATYRRSPSFTELALPLIPGLPLLAVGTVGLMASYGYLGPDWVTGNAVFYLSSALASVGGVLTLAATCALAGEVVSRLTFRDDAGLDPAAVAGEESAVAAEASSGRASAAAGAVATLTKPTVAEIRAMAAANRPKLDARGLAMQATAAKIKPLSNFIYRTMQVGVLLIAAGTILGGVWADYSWGRFWGWDPKEVWALITLLVYLIPLHGRFAGWFNTFALVVSSVVCSLSVIMAWYGVNFLLGVGLHSYGFVEGGGQGIVGAVILAVLALPIAAAWRRWLGSSAFLPAA